MTNSIVHDISSWWLHVNCLNSAQRKPIRIPMERNKRLNAYYRSMVVFILFHRITVYTINIARNMITSFCKEKKKQDKIIILQEPFSSIKPFKSKDKSVTKMLSDTNCKELIIDLITNTSYAHVRREMRCMLV